MKKNASPTRPKLTEEEIAALLIDAVSLNARYKATKEKLDAVKERLLEELEPGTYETRYGRRLTIVKPGTAIKPGVAQIAAAFLLAGKLAGKLFVTEEVRKPVDGFREIVRALLPTRRADKILALCEVPTSGQVRF